MDRHGELSNESPPRWIITADVITGEWAQPKKRVWKSWDAIAAETHLEPLVNGAMYQASNRMPIIFEGAVFGQPLEYMLALFERLETEGWLVRYMASYATRAALASALPFRPDIRAVIDVPRHVMTWGSRGITLKEISYG